jgi:hypothetical protein
VEEYMVTLSYFFARSVLQSRNRHGITPGSLRAPVNNCNG